MKVSDVIDKIDACTKTAAEMAKLADNEEKPGVFWDAEELLLDYAVALKNMEVKSNGKD